jgi:hypothetical protein
MRLLFVIRGIPYQSTQFATLIKKRWLKRGKNGMRGKRQGTRDKEQKTRNKRQGTRDKEQGAMIFACLLLVSCSLSLVPCSLPLLFVPRSFDHCIGQHIVAGCPGLARFIVPVFA